MLTPKDKGYINSSLRKVFGWSVQYRECKKRARIKGEIYRCEGCETAINKNGKEPNANVVYDPSHTPNYNFALMDYELLCGYERVFPERMFVDHIEPVVPLTGWYHDTHYKEDLLGRMFPGLDGLQYLCECCHYIKTQYENDIRRLNKNETSR